MSQTQAMPLSKTPTIETFPEELPTLQITQRRALPIGIATNVKQHVLLVRDHSSSMSGTKISELNQASQALVSSLCEPENKDGFRVSIIDFNHKAKRVCMAESPSELSVPTVSASGSTNFNKALEEALATIIAFNQRPNTEGWHYLRPCVLFLSDGQSTLNDTIVQELQEHAQVIAIAYGSDASEDILSLIASDGQVHIVGTDSHQLRLFLAEIGKTLSQTLQQNQ